jgi:hypothetical protein
VIRDRNAGTSARPACHGVQTKEDGGVLWGRAHPAAPPLQEPQVRSSCQTADGTGCDRDDLCDAGRGGSPGAERNQSILLANEIAGTAKIERFAELSREADLMVAVDNESNISALSASSTPMNVQLSILVDVDTGMGRCVTFVNRALKPTVPVMRPTEPVEMTPAR